MAASIILALAGAIFGAAIGGEEDLIWGAFCGFLLAQLLAVRRRLAVLERRTTVDPAGHPTAGAGARAEPPTTVAADPWFDLPSAPAPGEPAAPPSERRPGPATEPAPAVTLQPPPASAADVEPTESPSVAPRPAVPRVTAADDWAPAHAERPESAPAAAVSGLLERAISAVVGFFTGGNPLVRVGIVVLLIGVAFLLRYVAERVTVSIELRLAGIALGGIGLLALGLWLRRRRPEFALPIQGAGIGVLYLTVFAALRLYQLLPPTLAFSLMLVLVIATVVLAVWQDSLALAGFGVAGGFLAPIFASTGSGSHVQLFGFYLLLNVAIAATAWFRSWRLLNWLGFVFTFGIGLAWGAQYYRPDHFATVEPFLIAHVALYLGITVLYALRQPPQLRGLVDGTLVFGTPIIGFMLQAAMLPDRPTALAMSAVVLGAVHLLLAWLLRGRAGLEVLSRAFLALGAGFLTLAIPIAFDARVTSALWTLEGAAVVWVGVRQHRALNRIAGYILMVLGSLAWLRTPPECCPGLLLLNAEFVGIAIIAGAFFFVAHLLRTEPQLSPAERTELRHGCWLYAAAWLVAGGLFDLDRRLAAETLTWAVALYLSVTALGMLSYGYRMRARLPTVSAWLVALAAVLLHPDLHQAVTTPILNTDFLAVALACATLVAVGWVMQRQALTTSWSVLADGAILVATSAWLLAGAVQCGEAMARGQDGTAYWVGGSLLGAYGLARLLAWPRWRLACETLVLLAAAGLLLTWVGGARPGLVPWLAMVAAMVVLLYLRSRHHDRPVPDLVHALAFLTVIGWTTSEVRLALAAQLGRTSAWWSAALVAVPLVLASLVRLPVARRTWPVAAHGNAYLGDGVVPLALLAALWLAVSNFSAPPTFTVVGYLPLLNVLDLSCLAALVWLAWWWREYSATLDADLRRAAWWLLGGLAFQWLNAALLRAVADLLDLPWDAGVLWASFTVQASVTLLWVVTALALMIAGSIRRQRWWWTTGAGLIALAVVKLFVVDMAGSGSLARIVAFLGVAAGLILAGYFVPRPPARSAK